MSAFRTSLLQEQVNNNTARMSLRYFRIFNVSMMSSMSEFQVILKFWLPLTKRTLKFLIFTLNIYDNWIYQSGKFENIVLLSFKTYFSKKCHFQYQATVWSGNGIMILAQDSGQHYNTHVHIPQSIARVLKNSHSQFGAMSEFEAH